MEQNKKIIHSTHQGNPYLPLWEYIPDGEPYIFDDPDNPGKQRVYLYGSHDTLQTHYCGKDQVVWSASVDDLTQWRYDGVIFQCENESKTDFEVLYAPDIAVKTDDSGRKIYYLYPNTQNNHRNSMVAKSNLPTGPFEVCNWKDETHGATSGVLGFDPAVLVDDDGRVYGYWGFADEYNGLLGSYWGELDPDTMASLKEGTCAKRNIPTYDQMMAPSYDPNEFNIYNDEHIRKWGFFEASSIRKVGNKYVFIYSRNGLEQEPTGKNYAQLAYGYSDHPSGPWKYGGIIVDAAGETIPDGEGGYSRTYMEGNTHGSICEIAGQWYIFYHRNLHAYARQGTVEPIDVKWDEVSVCEGGKVSISMAEVTSNGFSLHGLNPFRKHSAGIACYLTGGACILPQYSQETESLPVVHITNHTIVGFKYFNFDNMDTHISALSLGIVPKGIDGWIDIYIRPTTAVNTPPVKDGNQIISVGTGSKKIGTLKMTRELPQSLHNYQVPLSLDGLTGTWGLFLVFQSEETNQEICDFWDIQFFPSL